MGDQELVDDLVSAGLALGVALLAAPWTPSHVRQDDVVDVTAEDTPLQPVAGS